MRFDPEFEIKSLRELMIPMAKNESYEEASQKHVLASYGNSMLATGVECCLVGLFDDWKQVLEKARSFLQGAINDREIPPNYARGGAEERRLRDFAMCNWFLDAQHDIRSLKEAVQWREIWFEETENNDKHNVQLTLPGYLDAEEYDALFHRFDIAKLVPPKNLRSIRSEGSMAYVLARHRLGLEFTDAEVTTALRTFLKRSVQPAWLDFGHATTVALWMKIAYWKPGDDPIATLLKCYEFMPEFEPPKYP